ncbi:hypothetical protein CKO27_09505 [Thiocystis violacea]|nr:hypothetical protein [Thiocystis violacea]
MGAAFSRDERRREVFRGYKPLPRVCSFVVILRIEALPDRGGRDHDRYLPEVGGSLAHSCILGLGAYGMGIALALPILQVVAGRYHFWSRPIAEGWVPLPTPREILVMSDADNVRRR